jgi:hypothetical protein
VAETLNSNSVVICLETHREADDLTGRLVSIEDVGLSLEK